MNELERYQEGAEELCEVIWPISTGLVSAIKDFFRGPTEKEYLYKIKVEMGKIRLMERCKILDTAVELAKLDKLSEDMFRLLMIAFSSC